MPVTVILLSNKERRKYFENCLNSVRSQTDDKDQIIVVSKVDKKERKSLSSNIPKDAFNVFYYENNKPWSVMMNDAILRYAEHKDLIIIDSVYILKENSIYFFKDSLKKGDEVMFSTIESRSNRGKDRRIGLSQMEPEVCTTCCFSFNFQNELLFNEDFTIENDPSILIDFALKATNNNKKLAINKNILSLEQKNGLDSTKKQPQFIGQDCNAVTEKIDKLMQPSTIFVVEKNPRVNRFLGPHDKVVEIRSKSYSKWNEEVRNMGTRIGIIVNPEGWLATNFVNQFKLDWFEGCVITGTNKLDSFKGLKNSKLGHMKEFFSLCFDKKVYDIKSWTGSGFEVIDFIREIAAKAEMRLISSNDILMKKSKILENVTVSSEKVSELKFKERQEKVGQKDKEQKRQKRIKRYRASEEKIINVEKFPKLKANQRAKILFVCDVKDWAWWIKSNYIKKYISDEFDINVIHLIGPGSKQINNAAYDLYFTFGYSYVDKITGVPLHKRITGVTAHRNSSIIKPKMSYAGCIHANSMLLYNEVKQYHPNVFYVPNGVDEEMFTPTPIDSEGQFVVGHVGKASPSKRQNEFLIPMINKAKVKKHFHMNNYRNKIEHKDMVAIYRKFDVYVANSIEDGTPNPMLEAMACGRPVIINKIGNAPELIKDGYNGFLIQDKDSMKDYINRIHYLRNNRDKLIEMGQNARQSILDGWTWKQQAENYRTMFRKILYGKKEKCDV